jgi:hypothetical protein
MASAERAGTCSPTPERGATMYMLNRIKQKIPPEGIFYNVAPGGRRPALTKWKAKTELK